MIMNFSKMINPTLSTKSMVCIVYLVVLNDNKWLIHVNKCFIMNQLLV